MNIPTIASLPSRSQSQSQAQSQPQTQLQSQVQSQSQSHSQSIRQGLAPIRRVLERGVRTISFWLAIAIPFLYVPLVLEGFAGHTDVLTFLGLLALNVVALVAGHDYGR